MSTPAGPAGPAHEPSLAPSAPASTARQALALLLVGPLLVNGISLMLAMVVFLKAAEHLPPETLSNLGLCYYLSYAISSYIVSRTIPARLAPLAVRLSLVLLGVLSLFLGFAQNYGTFLLFSLLNGGIIGLYFAPFQIAMGGVKPCRTVAWTIAFYNISWGTGAAFGPFVSDWLRALPSWAATASATAATMPTMAGPAAMSAPAPHGWNREVVLGVVVGGSILLHWLLDWRVLKSTGPAMPAASATGGAGAAASTASTTTGFRGARSRLGSVFTALVAAAGPGGAAANLPGAQTPASATAAGAGTGTAAGAPAPFVSTVLLRRIGFMGAAVVTVLRTGLLSTLWPALSVQEHLSPAIKGCGSMLLGLPIFVLAPVWALIHRRFDRPWLSIVLLCVGGAGVALVPFCSWQGQLIGLTMVGTAVSGLIYLAIFYSNADPQWPSSSVGVTEFCIGAGGLVGPLLLGRLAGNDAGSHLTYLVGAGLTVVTAIGVAVAWRRRAT